MLGAVLDLGISVNLDHLARTPEGNLRDGLPNRDRLGAIRTPSGKLDIMLDLVQRPDQPSIWLFSSETLRYIPEIFEGLDQPWFAKLLPSSLRDKKVFSLSLWRWFAIFLGITLALVLAGLSSRALIRLVRPLIRYTTGEEDDKLLSSLKGPIRFLFLSSPANAQ
jgi:MscS family membrane protein